MRRRAVVRRQIVAVLTGELSLEPSDPLYQLLNTASLLDEDLIGQFHRPLEERYLRLEGDSILI